MKWGAVGIPVAGAMYFGGRKLGFWGTSRRKEVQPSCNYIADSLLIDNSGNDNVQSYDEEKLPNKEKVAKRAEEIKGLVKEENYNRLKTFCSNYYGEGELQIWNFLISGEGSTGLSSPYLEEMFELIFVSGECDISKCQYKNDVGFCVSVPLCTFTISFRTNGKVVIIVNDKRRNDTRFIVVIW